jgi:thioredoxin 1
MRVMFSRAIVLAALALALLVAACGDAATGTEGVAPTAVSPSASPGRPDVTFVEIGSDSCIPCREMRPVMEAIEKRYSPRVDVVFVDVYEQRDTAAAFGVRVIPTQVFLDKDGQEFTRHEGFLPQEAIEELLAEHGVEPTAP